MSTLDKLHIQTLTLPASKVQLLEQKLGRKLELGQAFQADMGCGMMGLIVRKIEDNGDVVMEWTM